MSPIAFVKMQSSWHEVKNKTIADRNAEAIENSII